MVWGHGFGRKTAHRLAHWQKAGDPEVRSSCAPVTECGNSVCHSPKSCSPQRGPEGAWRRSGLHYGRGDLSSENRSFYHGQKACPSFALEGGGLSIFQDCSLLENTGKRGLPRGALCPRLRKCAETQETHGKLSPNSVSNKKIFEDPWRVHQTLASNSPTGCKKPIQKYKQVYRTIPGMCHGET